MSPKTKSRSPAGMIDIVIIGDDRGVQGMLNRLDTALNPAAVSAFLGGVVDPYLRGRMKDRFEDEGDDVTGAWEPLSEVTQHIRTEMGYGAAHPINHRTGQLENYLTGIPGTAIPNGLGATLTLPGKPPAGLIKKKMETAQRGKGRPHTPPRPVLGMNERDLAFVLTSLMMTVQGARMAGGRP